MTFIKTRRPQDVKNEVRFLQALSDTPFVPRIISYAGHYVELEHIESETVTDEDKFIRGCASALSVMRSRSIRHGDLTEYNVLVRDNVPVLVDFAESRFEGEPGDDKRQEGDAYHLWRTALHYTTDGRRVLRRWLAMRDHIVGKTMLDIGPAHGLFIDLANAEGYEAMGIDIQPEVSHPHIKTADIWGQSHIKADNILMLAVWPYLVQQGGFSNAARLLTQIEYKELFFEAQLVGDGPGTFACAEAVEDFLALFGDVTPLVTIEIPDRHISRTTYKVTA